MGRKVEGDTSLLALVQEVQALIEKRCHRFLSTRYGITLPQYRLLMAADRHKAATLGDLADEISCTRGNITGVTDRLERDGWLVRERSRQDRRIITLHLTAKGKRIRTIHEELLADWNHLLGAWTAAERQDFAYLLRQMVPTSADQVQAGLTASATR